jgi:diguanylate cyclase (GGDEF)-like protein/PAS domain S-box-containing protein
MRFLRRLSLRDKFLVTPIIGLLLISILAAIQFLAVQELNSLRVFVAVFVLAVVSMPLVAIYLSRLLSRDLNTMTGVMERLAFGDGLVNIPVLTTSPEVDAMAQALAVVKEAQNERERAAEQLQLAASVFGSSLEGIMITDAEARILSVNQAFTDITGYTADEALGQTPRLLRSDRHDEGFYRTLWASLHETGMWQGEIWNRRKNGEVYPEWRNISTVRDEQGRAKRYISIFTDITEKKLSEERVYWLAHYDVLTELPNRALFEERLRRALLLSKRHGGKVGILYLDIDDFKLVNDMLGHAQGDQLLQEIARRAKDCVRAEDTIARLGGDEFTFILQNLKSGEDAALVARKLLNGLAQPVRTDRQDVYVTVSLGISLYPDDGADERMLLKNADTAMYRAKEQGKNTYRFYAEEMNAAAVERMTIADYLRKAMDQNSFSLHYQPRIDAEQGRIAGLEALLRWEHPQLGLVPTGKFIPIAEYTGLIVPIGRWVFRTVCEQYRDWQEQGVAPPNISVNLSGRQFHEPGLVEDIRQIVADAGLQPGRVELEVTETFLMENPEKSIATLKALKSMGFHIAMDDFGTAYSSLSYLKRFPVDTLKIDRSFVRDIPDDPDDVAITKTIIAMAKSLGLGIVAEGVETAFQQAFLEAHGCNKLQGYFFSRPLTVDAATEVLHSRQSLRHLRERNSPQQARTD